MGLGTSEAIRLSSSKVNKKPKGLKAQRADNIFKEWLGGLIDGDGCFLLSKKGYASLEITKDLRDEYTLFIIKQKYGGSVKLRSGVSAVRYRLHDKKGLINLINDVNGLIRNPNRQAQQHKICLYLRIPLKYPLPLTNFENGWLSGLLDSDGTVTINKTNYQIAISISQKNKYILDLLVPLYGGNVYIDNSRNLSLKWYISSKKEIMNLIEYLKLCPVRSAKKNRLHLIPKLYELKELKAHLAPNGTILNKAWLKIISRFKSYSQLDNLDE